MRLLTVDVQKYALSVCRRVTPQGATQTAGYGFLYLQLFRKTSPDVSVPVSSNIRIICSSSASPRFQQLSTDRALPTPDTSSHQVAVLGNLYVAPR